MENQDKVPVKALLILYLVIFLAHWIFLPIKSWSDAEAVLILLFISLVAAVLVMVFTLRAPLWVLVVVSLVGLIGMVVAIYFLMQVPDGILTPVFIFIGGGIFLAELIVGSDRYWRARR